MGLNKTQIYITQFLFEVSVVKHPANMLLVSPHLTHHKMF